LLIQNESHGSEQLTKMAELSYTTNGGKMYHLLQ